MKITKGEEYDKYERKNESDMEDCANQGMFTPGILNKHGYYVTLSTEEVKALEDNGYKLMTNSFYKKGDFYEILDSKNRYVDIEELVHVLDKLLCR